MKVLKEESILQSKQFKLWKTENTTGSGIPDKSALNPCPISSLHTTSAVLIQALVDIVGGTKNKYHFENNPNFFSSHMCASRWH